MVDFTPEQRDEQLTDLLAQSIQSRAEAQPFGDMPFGGFVDTQLYDAGLIFSVGEAIETVPEWSIYPARRDRMLRQLYKSEPISAGAVYSVSSRIKSLDYTLSGLDDLQPEVDLMLQTSEFGQGLRKLVSKTVIDLLTQDNGAFWELEGLGDPDEPLFADIVTGVNHLDAAQCYRTYDPEYPVLYVNPIDGAYHRLHRTRVIAFSNMTQPNELGRGVGLCAISRALAAVKLNRAIRQYRYEKASGRFERAIGYGTGLTQRTLQKLLDNVATQDDAEGLTRFGRIPFVMSMKPIEMNVLDLASIPDGFDLMDETTIYVYTLAHCFGVDAREFWPQTSSGATKADASIQNMKARGKGFADLITDIEDALNTYVLPAGMFLEFDFVDDEHDLKTAEQHALKVDTYIKIKQAGGLTDRQLQAVLIHEGILDENVLAEADEITAETMENEPQSSPEGVFPPQGVNTPQQGVAPQFDPLTDGISPNEQPDSDENDDDEDDEIEDGEKRRKSQAQYASTIRAAIRGLMEGYYSREQFVAAMDSAVRRSFVQAWQEGSGLRRSEWSDEELNALQVRLANEQMYVDGLADYVISVRETSGSWQAVFARADMWASRYEEVRTKARLMANANKKYEWKFSPLKEHCADCANLNGRVYRAAIWDKYKIAPRSAELACFGTRCGCELMVTDRPVTPGRPPSIGKAGGGGRRRGRRKENGTEYQNDTP